MLVLSRREDEWVRVACKCGCTLDVMAVQIQAGPHGRKVRLGFEAPEDVKIMRSELLPGADREGGSGDV